MKNNPLVKAIMALLHLADSVLTSDASASNVRDRASAQRGVHNDPGNRPLKR